MQITPQIDGSLKIDQPQRTTSFDMGNRSLFVKTNGKGDVDQIYLAYGANAGSWQLDLSINGKVVDFQCALAIGRLWQLESSSRLGRVQASVFLEEKMTVVFERIEITAPEESDIIFDAVMKIDISRPAASRGKFHALLAKYIPRLPAFSKLWSEGWARYLQIPTPRSLKQTSAATLDADGPAAWQLTASNPFAGCQIHDKRAELHFSLPIAAGEKACLDLALAEAEEYSAAAVLQHLPAALENAHAYADWLTGQVDIADPLLKSLYVAGLNTARSMFKEFPGGFNGLVAGPDYAFPPRIYFRDGYWTAQALIGTAPELVRAHLLSLASGVHPDGQCPSGIFASHLLKTWHAPANCNADWLADHFDSPSFFILLLDDYLQATGDWELLSVVPDEINPGLGWPSLSVGQRAQAAIDYLISLDRDGDGLIEKPYAANDWADNIRRSIWVTYDQTLYIAALRAFAELCDRISTKDSSEHYLAQAETALQGMQRELWDEELGYFINYRRPGFSEKNLSADSLVTAYFHLLDEAQTQKELTAADFLLRAAHNHQQPLGNFGLLCAFPLYSQAADLFDKSALPYCYHNGADWPYLDGIYASILLERRDPAGLEVLTRWWSYGLKQGWLTPVEYYSPAYPVGGMLQGWSSMPAAVLFRHLMTIKEMLNEAETRHANRQS